MKVRELAVEGAFSFEPGLFIDARGSFCSPLHQDTFHATLGKPLFPVAQMSMSRSSAGVLRGLHYTSTPHSMAKYVTCAGGKAFDVVFDLREGSPTFGAHDCVELSPHTGMSLYLPPGVGHLFVALEDATTVVYLLSASYVADKEMAVHPLDPELGLELPLLTQLTLSDRDRNAPLLRTARQQGLLPKYSDVRDAVG